MLPQDIHCRILAGIVAGISASKIQAEGEAVQVRCYLVEASHVAMSSERPDHELGVAVQLLDQVKGKFCVAVLAIGGGDSKTHINGPELAALHHGKHLLHLSYRDACDLFYRRVRPLAVQQTEQS